MSMMTKSNPERAMIWIVCTDGIVAITPSAVLPSAHSAFNRLSDGPLLCEDMRKPPNRESDRQILYTDCPTRSRLHLVHRVDPGIDREGHPAKSGEQPPHEAQYKIVGRRRFADWSARPAAAS